MIEQISEKEQVRVRIIQEMDAKKMRRAEAAHKMGVSIRQLDRIRRTYAWGGAQALIHGNRNRPSHNRLKEGVRRKILDLVRSHYSDFGPTLAAEKLMERHHLSISREKLRQLMMEVGMWQSRPLKRGRAFQRRIRRSKRGELLQGDASPHDWFEGRGPPCDLVSFIDDATGHIFARFEVSETTDGYLRLLRDYIVEHGRPRALYTDRHSIFRVNHGEKRGKTAFGGILEKLNIELICAHTPQAKGRVERMYRTFQDRVVKEMRLEGISSIEEANGFLNRYLPVYNARFAKEPAEAEDGHRPLPQGLSLDRALSRRESRKISTSLDFSFHGQIYQLVNCMTPRRMVGQQVEILVNLEGEMKVEHKGQKLEIKPYREHLTPPVLNRKELNSWLDRKRIAM